MLGGVFALPSHKKRSSNGPVISVNFQDPSVIEADSTFYAYSGPNGNPSVNIQVATSPDFATWSVQSGVDLLPDAGSWAAATPHVWAPDVNSVRYVVYKVDGNSIGNGGACSNSVSPIQPTPILLHEVSPIDGVTLIGDPVQLLTNIAADGPDIEAPALAFDSSSETYFLFFNSGCYTSTSYNIQYATSSSVLGPYTRRGQFLATGDTAADVIIPGSIDVLPNDNTKAVFHGDINQGYLDGDGSSRVRAVYAIDIEFSGHTASVESLL
ncbi:hypothetical protein DV737_g4798, partial [Chaetothyriales sp. CBS 132003]